MNEWTDLGKALVAAFRQVGVRLAEAAPNIIGAAVLVLAGWLVARLARALVVRLVHLFEQLLHRLSRSTSEPPPRIPSKSVRAVGAVLFWVVILFFVAAATQVLGLDVFASWLRELLEYLPTLAAGGLIILAGIVLSGLGRDLAVSALGVVPPPQRALIGRLVQAAILITATVVGAEQIGIQVGFLVVLAAVGAAALLGGAALALSLGARSYVANLIGAHYLRQAFGIGQRVRIGTLEGRILEFTVVSMVIESAEGRVTVPAKIYNEEPIMLVGAGER